MSLIAVEHPETWPSSARLVRNPVSMFHQGMSGWRMRSRSMQCLISALFKPFQASVQTLIRHRWKFQVATFGNETTG
jgi:hypothetical protein